MKKNNFQKFRNIKLVSDNNSNYVKFSEKIRLENLHFRKSNRRSYADIISYPLELTVREWIKLSDVALEEIILSYEALNRNNRYTQIFREIDTIYQIKNTLYIVEIKVSSSPKVIRKAVNQLNTNYAVLRKKGYNVKLLIIHVDLNFKNARDDFNDFNSDFFKTSKTDIKINHNDFLYLHLKPQDIYNWGIEKGFILDYDLLSKALKETDDIVAHRNERRILKEQNISKEEWPAHLKETILLEDEENHIVNFCADVTSNPFADKLKKALEVG